MKKTPSLFVRDYDTGELTRVVSPGCEWVFDRETVATRKWDGTSCLWREGRLWKRYDRKVPKVRARYLRASGKTPRVTDYKPAPAGWVPSQDPDPVTFHWPGWIPVGDEPESKWHRKALGGASLLCCQTYELCGPKVQGNPEGLSEHVLIPHGVELVSLRRPIWDVGSEGLWDLLVETLEPLDVEGIVFWGTEGRRCKVTKARLGLQRKPGVAAYSGGNYVDVP